jgi:hypothetical protein
VANLLNTVPSCSCRPGVPLCDGTAPEYYTNYNQALRSVIRWLEREEKIGRYLHWAVHLNGLHIISLKDE